jgi:type II secretory pathway component PulJ
MKIKFLNTIKDKNGFGLLSILIALALIAILSVTMYTYTSKNSEETIDVRNKALEDTNVISEKAQKRADELNQLLEE